MKSENFKLVKGYLDFIQGANIILKIPWKNSFRLQFVCK